MPNPSRQQRRPSQLSKAKLDALVADAIADAYDESEQRTGLLTMIQDNLQLPFETTVPSGSAINTSAVGSHSFTVSATDNAGNSASLTVIYSVIYSSPNLAFFLPPIENNRVFKLGRTVPVKFQLTDVNGAHISTAVANAVAKLVLQKYSGSEPSAEPIEATSTSGADSGNLSRYDSTENQYIYNLSTSSLSTGTWQIKVMLDDGSTKTVFIGLK